jgi:prophage maintenance system killer protein
LGACLVFLRLNGVEPKPDSAKWESLTFAIADARIDRDEATKQLRLLLPKEKSAKKRKKGKRK